GGGGREPTPEPTAIRGGGKARTTGRWGAQRGPAGPATAGTTVDATTSASAAPQVSRRPIACPAAATGRASAEVVLRGERVLHRPEVEEALAALQHAVHAGAQVGVVRRVVEDPGIGERADREGLL